MIFNDFKGKSISALALGAMRLPTVNNGSEVDEIKTAEMVDYAIKNGVNYFDTAWGYHSGQSETILGKILSKYPRESFFLASKFPGYDLSNFSKKEEIFEKQLEKCRVDYFDFYLFHNLCELNADKYLKNENGIIDYIIEQKKQGKIKHLGLSVHADTEILKRFLDLYGQHIEFCQIQLNYIDYDFQKAKEKVKLLNDRNIPILIMEPLRGGKLAKLSEENTQKLKELRPNEGVTAWAFRYLQSIDGVLTILSGMSNLQQLKENIKTFEEFKPLNDEELKTIYGVAENMLKNTVPCTECRYCVDYCPKGLDIPDLLKLHNEHSFTNGGFLAPMKLESMEESKRPSACIGCKSCEAVCPQNIKISELFEAFSKKVDR